MWSLSFSIVLICSFQWVSAQNNCYFGPGAGFRGPSELVPCNTTGVSACCLLGDTCLSGNTCYNYATGNLYQYGCTDINYADPTCPQKCGWDPAKSPWIGLEYCSDIPDLSDTWTCLAPESCGCQWKGSYELQILPSRACGAMGSEARVALYAPSTLLPYVSLPATVGGSTGYYYATTGTDGALSVISTASAGYTPATFTQFTTYRALPSSVIYINPGATASPSTQKPAFIYNATTPPAAAAPSSNPAASTTASSPTTPLTTTTPATSPATSHTASATPAATSSGLSTGAKAGIGVGIAGGVSLIVALGLCWFLATRRKRNQQPVPPQVGSPPIGPYMHGQQPSGWAPFPPPGMPYYVVPVPPMSQKDGTSITVSPPVSPPRSPPPGPPATELSSEERRQTQEPAGYPIYIHHE